MVALVKRELKEKALEGGEKGKRKGRAGAPARAGAVRARRRAPPPAPRKAARPLYATRRAPARRHGGRAGAIGRSWLQV